MCMIDIMAIRRQVLRGGSLSGQYNTNFASCAFRTTFLRLSRHAYLFPHHFQLGLIIWSTSSENLYFPWQLHFSAYFLLTFTLSIIAQECAYSLSVLFSRLS